MPSNVFKQHGRSSIRLKCHDYSFPGAYFITICTYQHQSLFGKIIENKMVLNSFGQIVWDERIKTTQIRKENELISDEFVVMQNHLHGIIWIVENNIVGATCQVAPTSGPKSGSIGAIIGQFKSKVTKRINQIRKTQGELIWQRNYYDRVIRNESELDNIRSYILDNPNRWTADSYYKTSAKN